MINVKRFISNKTVKIRYKFVLRIVKKFTPQMYYRMNLIGLISAMDDVGLKAVSKVPRPAILVMEDYFSDNKVVGVEIGVFEGDNSESILNILNIEKLFLIDVWDKVVMDVKNRKNASKSYKKVLKRFKRNEQVRVLRNTSKEGSEFFDDESLDFVYIDAGHSYQEVLNDMECWVPKVRSGGVVAGHDVFNWAGVLKAVKFWCEQNKINFTIKLPDWYFIKV